MKTKMNWLFSIFWLAVSLAWPVATSTPDRSSWSQAAKLIASDGVAHSHYGSTIAISGDVVVVGAPSAVVGSNSGQGAVYVYKKPVSGWSGQMTQLAKLTSADGAAGDHFGNSVSISGDVVVVGAPSAKVGSNNGQGAAYVFVKPGAGWGSMTQTAKLTAPDGAASDGFGVSVSISGDAVAVGAYFADIGGKSDQGAAYVFVKPGSGWGGTVAAPAKLTAGDGAQGDELGSNVSIYGDVVAAAAPWVNVGSNLAQGVAYVFVKPGAGWSGAVTHTKKLVAPDGGEFDYLGYSIAVGSDVVAAGAIGAVINGHIDQGAVYVFSKPAGGWGSTLAAPARLTASDGAEDDLLGSSVAINGAKVIAGAYSSTVSGHDNQGAVYEFNRPGAAWSGAVSQSGKLTAVDGAANENLGTAVGISGTTVVAGAWNAAVNGTTYVGAAYVFVGGPQYKVTLPIVQNNYKKR